MIDTQERGPDIKREQVQQAPDLTDDTRAHRREEAIFGMSVPLMIGLVAVIFIAIVIIVIATM